MGVGAPPAVTTLTLTLTLMPRGEEEEEEEEAIPEPVKKERREGREQDAGEAGTMDDDDIRCLTRRLRGPVVVVEVEGRVKKKKKKLLHQLGGWASWRWRLLEAAIKAKVDKKKGKKTKKNKTTPSK